MAFWGAFPEPGPDQPTTLPAPPGYALAAGQRTRLEDPYCATPAEVLAARRATARARGPALGLGGAAIVIFRLVSR